MSTSYFDRSYFYIQLAKVEERLGEAIKRRLRAAGTYSNLRDKSHWGSWFFDRNFVGRTANVRKAVEESEGIALRNLHSKLGSIRLDSIWPVIGKICHDIALYLGGSALAGGAIGGGLGFVVFGGGAIPGALAGTAVGMKVGGMLLGFLGLKAVAHYMIVSIPEAAQAYTDGFNSAWGDIPRLDAHSLHGPHYGAEFRMPDTHGAARDFARGHEILVIALLMGIVTYLTRGGGKLPALLAEIRQSPRLGPRFATWVEQNADKLAGHPLLQVRNKGGGGAGSGGAGQAVVGERVGNSGKSVSPITTTRLRQRQLRSPTQLLGKSDGGPGTWQLSPKRSKGETFQEQITGVTRGIEYDVRLPGKSGKIVRFDGYDTERKVLLDAKDWKKYPPDGASFWMDKTLRDAQTQLRAAKGIPVEWHFSNERARQVVSKLFVKERINIALVLTPGP